MTNPFSQFFRALLALGYKKKTLKEMQKADPKAGMPRSSRMRWG